MSLPVQRISYTHDPNPFAIFTFQATQKKKSDGAPIWLPAFYLSLHHLKPETSCFPGVMEKVQYLTRSAIRRASTIEMPQQARQNLQNLFINFCLILICLLLICIIVMLLWSSAAISNDATCYHQLKICHPMKKGKKYYITDHFLSRRISFEKVKIQDKTNF